MNRLARLVGVRFVPSGAPAIAAGTFFFRRLTADRAWRGEMGGVTPALARLPARLDAMTAVTFAVAVVSGAVWLFLESAAISGLPLPDVYAQNVTWTVLTETRFWQICALRGLFAILLAVVLLPIVARRSGSGLVAVALAGAFLAALAWVGHAGAG